MVPVTLRRVYIHWCLGAFFLAGIVLYAAGEKPRPPVGFVNVASLAESSSYPETQEGRGLPLLIDGRTGRTMLFIAGSSGGGLLTFRFSEPVPTTALYFHQQGAFYRAESFRVLADAEGDGVYAVELGRGECSMPPSWSGIRWEARVVHGLRLEALTGFSGGARAYPAPTEVMIFGKHASLAVPVASVERPRPIRRTVDLSGRTRPVAILIPPAEGSLCRAETGTAPAWHAAGQRLAAELGKNLGIEARVTDQPDEALPERHNVIALGNVNTNELVARLNFIYSHYAYRPHLFGDSVYPGDGEFVLRTVFEPYPWYGQGDVIVIGASDPAGAERGIEELLERIHTETTSLPWTQVVSRPAALEETGGTEPTLMNWRWAVEAYFLTGDNAHGRRAVQVLEALDALYREKYAGAAAIPCWRNTHSWPEERESNFIFAAWDTFEAYPELTDDQRMRFSLVLLKALRGLPRWVARWAEIGTHDLVFYNHTTYPMLGIYTGARYFHHHHGIADMREYLDKAEACFMAQARSWKPREDAASYLEHTMRACRAYWLAEWRLDWFSSGHAARYADYIIGICDSSRGTHTGFGDSAYYASPGRIVSTILPSFWYTRDGRYVWILNYIMGDDWSNPFHRDVAPVPDREHVGLRVFPLDAQVYEDTHLRTFSSAVPLAPPNVPVEATFDKISFRAGWDVRGQYLLLDGFGRGDHLHFDTNAILTFDQGGHKWLYDHDWMVRNTTEHNMASVIRNGRSTELVPSCAGLRASADGPNVAMTATEVRDYMGLDWIRGIFWRKGRYFVVMEHFVAREAGSYDVDVTWKLADVGETRLFEPRVLSQERAATDEAPAGRFWLRCADAPVTRLTRYTNLRMPLPLVKLWQRIDGDLTTGDKREIANIFYADTPAAPVAFDLRRVGPGAVLVIGDEPALAATGGVVLDGLSSDAELLFATAARVAWAGGTFVKVGDWSLEREGQTSAELELPPDARRTMGRLLARLANAPAPAATGHSDHAPQPAQPAWTFTLPGNIRRLRAADLDGNGRHELLVAAGEHALALSADGRRLWSFALGGTCKDLHAGEADPAASGLEVVVVGGNPEGDTLFLLDARGELLRSQQVRALHTSAHLGEVASEPTAVAIYHTVPDAEEPRIFVATKNHDVITYDNSLTRRNVARRTSQHGGREFHAMDVNGDGRLEVFVTNRYGRVTGHDHEGNLRIRLPSSIGNMEMALGDLDGDGRISVVYGSSTGDLHCHTLAHEERWWSGHVWGADRWRFDNFGYAVNRLRIGDVDGNGSNEVLVASGTGYLYVLDGDGNEKWRHRAGVDLTDVVLLDHPLWKIACADRCGIVTLLDGTGRHTTSLHIEDEPLLLLYDAGHLLVGLLNRLIALPLP